MKVWSWRQAIEKSDLKPLTKLVLYTLANYMNDHGSGCYPSITNLAKATGLKERSVYNHIKDAEIAGFIIRGKRNVTGQQWASNEYKASYPKEMHPDAGVYVDAPLKGMHEDAYMHPDAPQGMHPDAGKGCIPVHTNSPMNSPSNIINIYKPPTAKISFEEFWSLYGKIGNKQQAEKSFKKIKGVCHEAIIAGLRKYQSYAKSNPWYSPKHASTWLNSRGWEDEYPTESKGNQPLARSAQPQPSKSERARAAAERGLAEYQGQPRSPEPLNVTPPSVF